VSWQEAKDLDFAHRGTVGDNMVSMGGRMWDSDGGSVSLIELPASSKLDNMMSYIPTVDPTIDPTSQSNWGLGNRRHSAPARC
jgi:hypothetical protein